MRKAHRNFSLWLNMEKVSPKTEIQKELMGQMEHKQLHFVYKGGKKGLIRDIITIYLQWLVENKHYLYWFHERCKKMDLHRGVNPEEKDNNILTVLLMPTSQLSSTS